MNAWPVFCAVVASGRAGAGMVMVDWVPPFSGGQGWLEARGVKRRWNESRAMRRAMALRAVAGCASRARSVVGNGPRGETSRPAYAGGVRAAVKYCALRVRTVAVNGGAMHGSNASKNKMRDVETRTPQPAEFPEEGNFLLEDDHVVRGTLIQRHAGRGPVANPGRGLHFPASRCKSPWSNHEAQMKVLEHAPVAKAPTTKWPSCSMR